MAGAAKANTWLRRVRPEGVFEQIIAGLVVAAIAGVVGLGFRGLLNGSDTNPNKGAAPSPTNESLSSSGPLTEDARAYYSLDGRTPVAAPTCNGLFSLCLASPVERAVRLLGLEEELSGDEGDIRRAWTIGDAYITVGSDATGSIRSLHAALQEIDPHFRLSLPEGLILGTSTMQDVVDTFGEPHDTSCFSAENWITYSLHYQSGPEGSEHLEFGYSAQYGSDEDPGGFNSDLFKKALHSFGVSYDQRLARSSCS